MAESCSFVLRSVRFFWLLSTPPHGDAVTLSSHPEHGSRWPRYSTSEGCGAPQRTSFKPLAAPISNSIDGFISAKLKEHGLTMSPEAEPAAWLRRVSFDLTGLPPTPEEVAAFHESYKSHGIHESYSSVVERLLASPRYGERYAQHWLDVVRYADTHGFEVNTERPNAWPYRDYVINAFNNDTPYDRFIKEQFVGDAMGQDAATGFLVTASVLLPGQIGKDDQSKRLARQDSIDEIVVNIGQTFLGLSIGCARCHDHKFDPITAKDYYAMQAFVAGVEYGDRDLHTPEAEAARAEAARLKLRLAEIDKELARFVPLVKSGAERPMINARENADRFAPMKAKRVRFTIKATNNLEPCIDELEVFNTSGENVALATAGTLRKSGGDIGVAERHELRFINDGRYGNGRSWMAAEKGKGWVELEFTQEQTVERIVWGRDREGKFTDRLAIDYQIEISDSAGQWHTVADASDRRKFNPKDKKEAKPTLSGLSSDEAKHAKPLIQEKADIEARIKAAGNAQKVFAGTFRTPDNIHLLNRGDPEQPKDEITPAVLSALGDLKLPKESAEQQRRQTLAEWIARPQNPLTARVMVNRLWQGHFGTGLVSTPSDFGHMGMKPSHPELLDWLAAEFIRSGWSVKHMHRLIVLSAAYRQSSRIYDLRFMTYDLAAKAKPDSEIINHKSRIINSPANTIDAESRLLWRFPSRRLEAESIRDSILAVSGQLNLKMHGRGFNLFDQRGGLSGFDPIETFTPDNQRRMIYAHKVRREPETVFGAFDCPDAGQSAAIRRASTTPIQALNLFNSLFTLAQAEAFASRVRKEAGDDPTKQINRAYQLALSREPTADELSDTEPIIRKHGIATLCRALFNSNEFLFVP
ncbi:MAG: DUF1549 and DUF1553 domain-containing protein [Prosthecobacter sp.]|uniref:DUF1549 and DUF1553 domain-containing protein n=1 Tax=Prosthecobacter sp. TaxID=1965333 RepID=UPI003900CDB9